MDIVEILLSVYNGEMFLSEQLESIEYQSNTNWLLTVRDDGSTDGSLRILRNFQEKYPQKINLLKDHDIHLGICLSYSRLMEASTAKYVMFCDQDDVWLPRKIDKTLSRMKLLEKEKGERSPLLVHCDLMVVNKSLIEQHNSFWSYQGLNPDNAGRLNRELVMNVVTGCSMMINRPLLDLAKPISNDAMVHDWWVAQTAAAFGSVGCVNEPLVFYRQHGDNQIGARSYKGVGQFVKILKNLLGEKRRYILMVQGQMGQGKAFYNQYKCVMSDEQKKMFDNFFRLYESAPIYRFLIMAKNGFWRSGVLRNIAMGMMFRCNT
jgi:glycosyltransferase involved in cell wall biosynthesis